MVNPGGRFRSYFHSPIAVRSAQPPPGRLSPPIAVWRPRSSVRLRSGESFSIQGGGSRYSVGHLRGALSSHSSQAKTAMDRGLGSVYAPPSRTRSRATSSHVPYAANRTRAEPTQTGLEEKLTDELDAGTDVSSPAGRPSERCRRVGMCDSEDLGHPIPIGQSPDDGSSHTDRYESVPERPRTVLRS